MNLTSHLAIERLADMAEKISSPDERAASAAHLSTCPLCAGQLARLENLIGMMRTDDSEDAPRDVISGAVALFAGCATEATTAASLLRRIVAALSFDSTVSAPAYGVRAGQPSSSRQILYSAGDNDLDLRVTPSGDALVVSGQVLGDCSGGEVELKGAGRETRAALNETCEFTLPPVPSGSYSLLVRLDGVEVEVPELELSL